MQEFRERLKQALDDAVGEMIASGESWDKDLDRAADYMEEFLGEELGRIVTGVFLSMQGDLSKAEKEILNYVEELRARRTMREKLQRERK